MTGNLYDTNRVYKMMMMELGLETTMIILGGWM